MANNIEEQISALVDGETTGHETNSLLGRIQREPALRERWRRYNLIRDALHKNLPSRIDHDLFTRVQSALEAEPVFMPPPQARTRRIIPWAKQVAGLAIAASVTAVAILGFQALHAPDAFTPGANTVASTAGAETTEADPNAPDPELEPYLVNHTEHAVSAGMHGMLPYVRLVSQGDSE